MKLKSLFVRNIVYFIAGLIFGLVIAFISMRIFYSGLPDIFRYSFLYSLGLPTIIANKLIGLNFRMFCNDSTFGCWSVNIVYISSILYGLIFVFFAYLFKIIKRKRN
jgi:hypothetical protein